MIDITSPTFIPEERLAAGADLAGVFGNDRPLALEIGCGIGDFIVQLARQQPETNFLAIDIYNKGCHKTCKKIDAAGLENVRVLRLEARYLLTRYLPRQSLSAIYINCPDPWPKKRHRDRRLVDKEFLHLAFHYLRPGGELYFSTDFGDYAEQVAQLLLAVDGYRNCLASPYALELPGYPVSKYMRRFLEQGQPIHFIHYRREDGARIEAIPLPAIAPGFRVRWSRAENE
jgi:tRNA (guanine-N7-)-methyltransferase